jgi:hypothetical protein
MVKNKLTNFFVIALVHGCQFIQVNASHVKKNSHYVERDASPADFRQNTAHRYALRGIAE